MVPNGEGPVPSVPPMIKSLSGRIKAVTLFEASMVIAQVPARPVHAPLHPANVEPLVDVAVNVIGVPLR